MFNISDLKNLDVTQLDLGRLDLSKIDLPKIDLPKVDLPKMDLGRLDPRNVDFPDLPEVDLSDLQVDRITDAARDAAYAGIGVAVTVAEQADRRRRELSDEIGERVRKLVAAAG